MNLIDHYQQAIGRGDIDSDPSQLEILDYLQNIADALKNNGSWWFFSSRTAIKGLYLYGAVGVGKTYLVDLFYQYIDEEKKNRFHFHHFMQQIDAQLRQFQGKKDPLRHIAKKIAQSTRLLCFDEFLVDDVAYAMILAQLLEALINEGVVLVISSNTPPDELYLNGVQRDRFLPAIALINLNCHVVQLNKKRDYRLGRQPLIDAYLFPLNSITSEQMERQFYLLADNASYNEIIVVQGRPIPFIRCSGKIIWFSFDVLCNLPRSQLDYLEIADRFETVFVSQIPCLTENHTAQTIMFIHLIDVMYDRGIKMILSAAVPLDQLYVAGEMFEPFKRTISRLTEMQSVDYLSRHPRRSVFNIV